MAAFPKPKARGDREPSDRHRDRDTYNQYQDTQYAYIPATPENLAAVEDLIKRMSLLRQRVESFLSQDRILKALKSGNLLALENKGP